MVAHSTLVTVTTYFNVHSGELDAFKARCQEFVDTTSTESGCVFIEFAFEGARGMTIEGYKDAAGVLDHLRNVRELMEKNAELIDVQRVELHGLDGELDKLREPLAAYSPRYYSVEYRFGR